MNTIKKIQSNLQRLCQSYNGDHLSDGLKPTNFNYYRVNLLTLQNIIQRQNPEIIFICYRFGANNTLSLFNELLESLSIPKRGKNILQQADAQYIVVYLEDLSIFEVDPPSHNN